MPFVDEAPLPNLPRLSRRPESDTKQSSRRRGIRGYAPVSYWPLTVNDYTLRQFTTFYCQAVPKHHAFHRAFIRLTPKTLKAVNELVVQAAVKLGLEDGNRLRVDTTVVQADIHYPADNTLLWDVVRVVTRLVGRLKKAVQKRFPEFRNRKRAARRRMQEIQRMTPKERPERQTKKYRELIGVTEEVVNGARKVVEQTSKARGKDLVTEMAIGELRKEINHYCQLGDQVISQARRRVLEGEQVPNAEKIYSIFEPRSHQARQGANASGVRSQSFSRRECPMADYAI
jgi:transposase, IS5 family